MRIQLACFRRTINRATPPTEKQRETDQDDPGDPTGAPEALKKKQQQSYLCSERHGGPSDLLYIFQEKQERTITNEYKINETEREVTLSQFYMASGDQTARSSKI